jgi:hypothetical protein
MFRSRLLFAFFPLLLLAPLLRCAEDDPLAARLAQRTHYTVDVITFSPRDDGRLLVEVEVRAGMGRGLKALTATIRQHGPDQSVVREDRVPLDLSDMDATGVIRLYTEVPAHDGTVDGISALVEHDPPPSEYVQFPEIVEVTGP